MLSLTLDNDLEKRLEALGATTDDSKIALVYEALRDALKERLERRCDENVAEQYRRAYGEDGGLGEEFEGWEAQGVWPPK